MIEPEPSIEPASAMVSKSYERSRSLSSSTGADDPPGTQHFTRRPSGGPPARPYTMSRERMPSSISKLPGRRTLPDTDTILVPVDFSVPTDLNHSAPFSMIAGTLQSVSTLLIRVGP